jgi:hypothetical protein
MRTGLLRALNIHYATFHFTDTIIILNVLPYDSQEIFSFLYPRSSKNTPAEDFSKMANRLGSLWWAEKRRSQKRYCASRIVLKQAIRNHAASSSIQPIEDSKPSHVGKSLLYLKLDKSALKSPDLNKIIKSAYRRQAKKHHPDHGGNVASFRKIYQAYEQIMAWAENPSFITRRGVPNKWFYDGGTNKWLQPSSGQADNA